MMRSYQKRGTNLINSIEQMKEIQDSRDEKKALEDAEAEDIEFAKAFLEERAKLPKDIVQKIVSGEKFDDTNLDNKPKERILTREEALRRMSNKEK